MFRRVKSQKSKVKSHSVSKIYFLTIFSLFYSLNFQAQCAMCRAALESDGNTKQAEAVNDGIVYLMIIPYVIAAVIGFAVYKMFKRSK